jgi:predicted membrane metal-binding protein
VELAFKLVNVERPSYFLFLSFIIPFIIGIIVMNSYPDKGWIAGAAFIPFGSVIIYRFIGTFLNNLRIKHICKELEITVEKYNLYVNQYL